MGEKKIIHFVLDYRQTTVELIKKLDIHFQNCNPIVYQKWPWYLPKSISLQTINVIPFDCLDGRYGASYYSKFYGIMIQFNINHIVIDYFTEIYGNMLLDDIEILKEIFNMSNTVLLGFETELDINNLEQSIKDIIFDNSLHPILLIEQKILKEYNKKDELEKKTRILNSFIEPLLK
jgi:hypothetical protein